ncbi:MAG: SufS family cysteine desulfurase [Candidatus Marsarchaeota archaeon]|nr:SufS family cysteine desulfurase [Candidatus Marsarchaeota archaeon]MCL5413248.1 SufS family cysteine desulfurase [Candidatus Marsarchaeota archaeon]
MNVEGIRKDFPIFNKKVNGKELVFLDSASTSQKPRQVIDAVNDYYENYNSNIHRGLYYISAKSTDAYIRSKELAAKFINAESYKNIVYCRNTTDAINIISLSYAEPRIKSGDRILITDMEHHSNIVPWLMLAKRKKAFLDHVSLKDKSFIDIDDFKSKLAMKPKIVAFTHASNVLGTINDVKLMTRLAHEAGATVIVDCAQSAPHMKVDVRDMDCDFMAFSSHKMLGPSGIGVLYGKEERLEETTPAIVGSDMIRSVSFNTVEWNELPWKFESGTPNIEGAIGFGAAIEYINKIGIEKIRDHEVGLLKYALKRLSEPSGITIHGPGYDSINSRGGAISFDIKGAHPHDVSTIFDSEGIAIRAGHHCAMPLVNGVLEEDAVSRMSFYLYNKQEEVDKAIDAIDKVRRVLRLK